MLNSRLHELIPGLDDAAYAALSTLPVHRVKAGAVLFRPGDEAQGFVLLLDGAISVNLTGRGGRAILLYEVQPGQTCVQTTLCLLGEQAYSAEGVARGSGELLVVPRTAFGQLLADSPSFRAFVFRSFGVRLADVTTVLEQVAFVSIEARLAAELLRRAEGGDVALTTHQDLASSIGSAREVVSRRLENLSKQGLVRLERGQIHLLNRAGIRKLAETDATW
jgi:CRP/FNR family transcriptional regulator, anaerobic regulatory protein